MKNDNTGDVIIFYYHFKTSYLITSHHFLLCPLVGRNEGDFNELLSCHWPQTPGHDRVGWESLLLISHFAQKEQQAMRSDYIPQICCLTIFFLFFPAAETHLARSIKAQIIIFSSESTYFWLSHHLRWSWLYNTYSSYTCSVWLCKLHLHTTNLTTTITFHPLHKLDTVWYLNGHWCQHISEEEGELDMSN